MSNSGKLQMINTSQACKDIPGMKLSFEMMLVCFLCFSKNYQNLELNNFTDFKNPNSFFPKRHNPKYHPLFQCKHQSPEISWSQNKNALFCDDTKVGGMPDTREGWAAVQ